MPLGQLSKDGLNNKIWVGCPMSVDNRLDRLSSMLRRRGIVLPSFEIYGGVAGLVDYGPVGARLKRKVNDAWIGHWSAIGNVVEVDSPTITPEPVLVASGHVGEFNDQMSECKECGSIFRSDHLLSELHPNPETLDSDEIDLEMAKSVVKCPVCGSVEWKGASPMNLMFRTQIGAMGEGRTAYMRPETAQGMFMLYPSLFRHFRQKLPFGAVQTGKGYRNEISPRQGMIRLREFNMAEMEYFIDPKEPPCSDLETWTSELALIPDPDGGNTGDKMMTIADALAKGIVKHPTVAWFIAMTHEFLVDVGIDPEKIRFRQHASTEMAHYASDCWDCELFGEYGWVEAVGIANRTCHDLESHEAGSGSGLLRGWRKFNAPRRETREVISPVGAIVGPAFKQRAADVSEALSEMAEVPKDSQFSLKLKDGSVVEISSDMFERRVEEVTIHGEFFTPHVIEPAFGIDRIIWHILDHRFKEMEKDGENYTILSLPQTVAPIDIVVLPLFDKDGMGELSRDIYQSLISIKGVKSELDTSRSIGRRYARADEIGIPWAITIDHESIENGTITVRRRDDQKQVRTGLAPLLENIAKGTVDEFF